MVIDANSLISIFILVISHAQRYQHRDVHRFEKISNIIKQFKLSCSKLAAHFEAMEVSWNKPQFTLALFAPISGTEIGLIDSLDVAAICNNF